MMDSFDFRQFTCGVEDMTNRLIGDDASSSDLVSMMDYVVRMAEANLDLLMRDQICQVACKAGCGTCCTVNVSVLAPEAMAIAHFLRRHLKGTELEAITEKIERSLEKVRWLDDEERIMSRLPCAFLDEQERCLIHPVRPLLCRGPTSTDPEQCREALAMEAFGISQPVEANLFQKALMDQAYRGLAAGLKNLGWDNRGMELTCAVWHFLSEPQAEGDFLSGKKISFH